jgi:hypothetical protein
MNPTSTDKLVYFLDGSLKDHYDVLWIKIFDDRICAETWDNRPKMVLLSPMNPITQKSPMQKDFIALRYNFSGRISMLPFTGEADVSY